MTQTIAEFGAECHAILKHDSGPEGQERVRLGLEKILADEAILAAHLGPTRIRNAISCTRTRN